MKVFLLMGPPGAGKGTQARKLVEKYHWTHIATGDLLREEIRLGTSRGQAVQALVESGKLVPDELMIELVESRLTDGGTYLLDGFPRTLGQAQALEELLTRKGAQLTGVLFLEVPEAELIQRLLRRSHAEGRADDTPHTIQTRLQEYRAKTAPLLSYYEERGILYRVPGLGDVEEIGNQIAKIVETLLSSP
ncbi:MAG: adenylate kinase [Bacteroidia bacterium]|nr:adenylate kinase [Bacteroidia bacterium]MDW8015293.1 adenylate kinase [Bacteroidia bacterium]